MRAVLIATLVACHATPRPSGPLVTTGETSHWARTGRYDEAVRLCHDFAASYPGVACREIGRTAEDREIVALEISRAKGPWIYVEGGIHAGEIEGKDAGYWFLRDLLDGKIAAGALDHVNVVFVPVINPDGHERFGPNNRPNQRGPIEMGFRTNGARLNINRDFMKADSEEMRAILGVWKQRDPVVFVDLHTTDGAKFEHDVAIDAAPVAPRADQLDQVAQTLSKSIVARLTALGHLPINEYYPSFVNQDDPPSGFTINEPPPRFSQAYAASRGRIGILVETHSWKTYAQRVQTTYHFLQALAEAAVTEAPVWERAARAADAAALHLGGGDLPLAYDNTAHTTTIDFRGYAYKLEHSDLSNAGWITYDETVPQIWKLPLRDELVVAAHAAVPRAGYVIDGGFAKLARPILDAHGIAYTPIAGQPKLAVTAFRATKATSITPTFEGRARMKLEGAWAAETRTLDRGAIFVPIAQPLARLIVHLLDPDGPDSLAQWGVFATAFERKEYMESYLAEEAARALLAKDPQLKAQFEAALAADPELAKSADRRLDWFYAQTPAWDERMNLYPVFRVAQAP
ncbi:MAG: M14 family zinc carboxypeptidase [Kofleriaceae bacterium]